MVYRQSCSDSPNVVANGLINDGLWHTISLSLTPHISLSLDNGRVGVTLTQSSSFNLTQLTIGGDHAPYSGCVRGVTINSQLINLASSDHSMTPDVVNGCINNQTCPTNPCPMNSTCTNNFTDLVCTCEERTRAENGRCVDPCASMPCVRGNCRINVGTSSKFACACISPYTGLLCDQDNQPCSVGYYTSSCSSGSTTMFCRPCVCDQEGVVKDNVCDSQCGDCSCDVSHLYIYGHYSTNGTSLSSSSPLWIPTHPMVILTVSYVTATLMAPYPLIADCKMDSASVTPTWPADAVIAVTQTMLALMMAVKVSNTVCCILYICQ